MFRPPFLARVAAGAAVYALEETRRLPTTAINFPITAISQMLQTTMHFQQFVTSLALKGDAVFDRLVNQPEEQPAWATFDEDEDLEQTPSFGSESVRKSRFDLFTPEESAPAAPVAVIAEPDVTESAAAETEPVAVSDPIVAEPEPVAAESAAQEAAEPEAAETEAPATASIAATNGHNGSAPATPEVASRFNYDEMTIAQLRARLRQLSVEDLSTLLAYEQGTRDRAPFVTMLTNRIATVQAK